MNFWQTPTFHDYERLCGDEPGTRARLLAAADWNTRVVDLSLSEAELWQNVRRSYKSIIHAAERTHQFVECNAQVCHRLHRIVAGRITRPGETWHLQDVWIDSGHGLAMVATLDGPAQGFAYCVIYGAWAYYHSGATLTENISHALLWHAMQALKARGVRWLEIGWLERAGDTQKQLGIVQFKKGWPGVDMPAADAPQLCARG